MFLPVKVARKLSTYLTYGLFCAFSLGAVLYAGKEPAGQFKTVLATERAMHHTADNVLLAKRGARMMMQEDEAEKPVAVLAQEAQQAAQAYEAATARFDWLVMAWIPLAICWLVLISVYADAESWSGVAVSFGVAVSIILFLFRFFHAFGPGIWQWLQAPIAGHSHGVWLLGAAAVGVTVAAIRHDFFRAKSLTPTE